MRRFWPSRSVLLVCGLLAALAAMPAAQMWRDRKQEQRNSALLEAVTNNNTEAALLALQEGGDAKMTVALPFYSPEPPHAMGAWLRWRWEQFRQPQTPYMDEPLLPLAVDHDNIRLVKALLQRGANPNNLLLSSGIDDPLLMGPVISHNVEIARALLDAGAWVDTSDGAGNTPFTQACGAGNLEIARLLLERGADVNHSNRQGGIPLTYAIGANDPAMVALLIAHKVDVNNPAPNNTAWTHADRIDNPVIRRKIKQLLRQAGAKQ